MNNLIQFLKTCKTTYVKKNSSFITLVLGNESCDLDSLVSSVSYAYLRQLQVVNNTHFYIPILCIPEKDFELRGDSLVVVKQFLEATQHLLFLDQFDFRNYSGSVVLVDHNELSNSLSFLSPNVTGIVDHHVDVGSYPCAQPRIIEPVGSATSLIVLEWMNSHPRPSMNQELATFMLTSILVDTIHLDPNMNRYTDKDKLATEFLLSFIPVSSHTEFTLNLYNQLIQAKEDLQHLSSMQLLKKDFKAWNLNKVNLGISSVTWNLHDWMQRERAHSSRHLVEQLQDFARENSLDIACIMTAYTKNEIFHRELVILVAHGDIPLDILDLKLVSSELNLEMIKMESHNQENIIQNVLVYKQHNCQMSRKQVQPILQSILLEYCCVGKL